MNNVKNYTEIGNVGRFIIPEKMKKKIDILHREVGSTEWSGILVYKTLVKSVRSLKDLVFKGEDIFPMDVGTAAATGFKYDGNVVDVYTNIPKALEMNIGTVHSHHGMSSFFSATDMDDIADNAKHYNYYISLVVSFDGKYKCKIAIPTKTSVTSVYKFRDRDGKIKTSYVETEREDVIVGDLSVIVESNYSADQWFMDRIAEIKKKAVYVKKPSVAKVEKSPAKSVKSASLWDDDLDLFTINSLSFNNFTKEEFKNSKLTIYQIVKTIEEMDDLEFEGYVDSLERNVSLVHYDVYGPNRVFEEVKHVQHIIDTLKSYKYISTVVSNRINEITQCLQDSIAYERESGYQCEV